MLHFVKQFKRKKTTFENFFVQKTNAEYTVTDNAQEAFPEKPCGSAVKAVVPCLLKINLHFSKPHLRKTAVENGQRTKAFLRNAQFLICDMSHFQHGAKHSYILKDLTVKIVPQTEIDGMFSKFAKPLIKNKITVLF